MVTDYRAVKRVAVTGGIACGKSLVAKYLDELGYATIDADDVAHELVSPEERARLAKVVFRDPAARRELEARLHPVIRARIEAWLSGPASPVSPARPVRIAIVPLLFEVHWDGDYDIICCVTSEKETQVSRMVTTRGYTREEAEARIAAQMPLEEKASKSHYVIANDGSAEDLRESVAQFAKWLER
jgi:dephospho-CoA kinase